MKYITFTVPCYNSQDYIKRCIDSLLKGGDDVEIIIVDDGSTDKTGEIADLYEVLNPDIVRVVHKDNGGHGSGVNAGLELASGLYFKVVDSDDWLDEKAYSSLLKKIKTDISTPLPDLIVTNYIYDHFDEGIQKSMGYDNVFPEERLCTWNDIGRFRPSQYLIMHSLMYRTKVLKKSKVKLPEHTFYVDNIFAYKPLPYVRGIYYVNVDLYHYYLGRDDQSVNEKVLIKRIDQQLAVTKIVCKCSNLYAVKKKYPKLAAYMKRNISIMTSISDIHLLLMGTDEGYRKRKELWDFIKVYDKSLYYHLRYRTLSGLTNLPGKIGGTVTIGGYRLADKFYKFQ